MRKICTLWLLCALMVLLGSGISVAGNETGLTQPASSEVNASGPLILRREGWQAKQPLPGMEEQNIVGIVLHHTGVRKNPKVSLENKMRGLQSFSQRAGEISPGRPKPAWPDVPYHYYIDVAGRIAEGRDLHFAGDTNTKYDTTGFIQVVIEGDFEKESPEQAQLVSLRDLLAWLVIKWNIPLQDITVHKNHAATDCPGRHFLAVLPTLIKQVAEQRGSIVNWRLSD
jgi:hypothetical protein